MDFQAAKSAYREARERERQKIVRLLTDLAFDVVDGKGAGHGPQKYPRTSDRITPQLDLSNWMWVEGTSLSDPSIQVLVTLQVLDWDPSTRNVHALFDRIGVIPFCDAPHPKLRPGAHSESEFATCNLEADKWVSKAVLLEQYRTNIDLPLTTASIEELKALIIEQCKLPSNDE